MERVKFGLIGYGNAGKLHARSILEIPNADLVAVATPNRKKVRELIENFKIKYYEDFREMLKSKKMDAVCVLTPSGTHADIGIEAAKCGKHVVVEKPIDISLKKADALINECEKHGVKLSVISQRRFSDSVKEVKEYVDNGTLGKLDFGGAQVKWYRSQEYYDSANWRGTWTLDGGGALMNQSVHYVDLLRYLVGPIKEVFAYCATKEHDIEVEDLLVGTLKFENGALGSIEATTIAYPGLFSRLDIYASNGSFALVDDEIETIAIKGRKIIRKNSSGNTGSASPEIPYSLHKRQLEDITHAILEDRPPAVSGRDGRNTLAVVKALYESCRYIKPVKVDTI